MKRLSIGVIERDLVLLDSGIAMDGGPAVDERIGQPLDRTLGNEH